MHTKYFTSVLDTWVGVLQTLNAETWTKIVTAPNGGMVVRLGELRGGGLITSLRGRGGGYKLTLPFEEITFSHLLALRDLPSCPTVNLYNRYADCTLPDILSWDTMRRTPSWLASLGAVAGVLSTLNETTPVDYQDINVPGIGNGYTLQIIYRTTRLGVTIPTSPKGGVTLAKPFDMVTVQDIAPLLSLGYVFYNRLIAHSANVPLKTLIHQKSEQS